MTRTSAFGAALACLLASTLVPAPLPAAAAPLRLGLFDNPPQTFVERGRPQGFIVDLLGDFCERRGYRLEVVSATFPELFDMIRRDEVDVIGPIAYTEERSRFLTYSGESILIDWSNLIVAEASAFKQLSDLQGRTVGGVRNDRYFTMLQADLHRQGISCRFAEFPDFLKIAAEVGAGRVDAGFIGRFSLGYLIKAYGEQLRVEIMPGTFYHEPLYFGINPLLPGLSRELDDYIRTGKRTGDSVMKRLQAKWFGQATYPSWLPALWRHLPWIISAVLLAITVSLAFALLLRRRALASAREVDRQRQHFTNLFETMPAGIAILDDRNRVVDANPEFVSMFGYSLDELRARGLDECLCGDGLLEACRELSSRTLKGERVFSEGRRRTADGRLIDVAIIGSPIVADGRLQGSIAVYIDNTEKKQMEAEILRSRNIESIGLMAGGIAHDFNNMLTAIIGHISLARRNSSEPAAQRPLEKAGLAASKATDLTRQLLTFAHGGEPVKRNVDLAAIIRDASDLVISSTPIRLQLDIEPDLPACRADSTQITQVVHNLLINAREAMGDTGTLDIVLHRHVQLHQDSMLRSGEYFALSVADNGPGIPEANLQKIFLPYFSTKRSGSGLGLAICYAIVRRHGGNIAVYSQVGHGTRFTVYLPMSAVEEKTEPLRRTAGEGSVRPPSSASR